MYERLKTSPKVVGVKQTRKAILSGEAMAVYIARDAERRVIAPIVDACEKAGISPLWADTMTELGTVCRIEVGAACAAVLANE
ncbi:MAG: ribosomal L7Ae/L30e/S12e/Gadd45 family protein [Oscillospiraceae bacterium]|nr:ribosomal L7Ae/L30e/S12e/Gadd45 family protein [Oscillospiraceae bacterium]